MNNCSDHLYVRFHHLGLVAAHGVNWCDHLRAHLFDCIVCLPPPFWNRMGCSQELLDRLYFARRFCIRASFLRRARVQVCQVQALRYSFSFDLRFDAF